MVETSRGAHGTRDALSASVNLAGIDVQLPQLPQLAPVEFAAPLSSSETPAFAGDGLEAFLSMLNGILETSDPVSVGGSPATAQVIDAKVAAPVHGTPLDAKELGLKEEEKALIQSANGSAAGGSSSPVFAVAIQAPPQRQAAVDAAPSPTLEKHAAENHAAPMTQAPVRGETARNAGGAPLLRIFLTGFAF